MKAFLKNYRQSPRKVRLVADLVKGKSVEEASYMLEFLTKRASNPMKKLLESAVANAEVLGRNKEMLVIKDLRVDKGIVLKRFRARAMGSGARINKRSSHVTIELGEKVEKKPKTVKKSTKTTKKKAEKAEEVK